MKDIGIVCSALYIVVYRYPVDVISDQVQYENTSMYLHHCTGNIVENSGSVVE